MAQQNNGNDLEKLYKAVSERFDIGDYDSFSSKMQTTEDRLRFYNVVSERGFDLGDYNDYESRLGKSLEVPAVGSVDTSVESVEPTSPTEVSLSAPTESSPAQNATLSEQSLTGDQFLNALNKRNRDIAGLTGLEDVLSRQTEVVIPEGTEIVPNAVGPDGLPVYAKLNEDGTYTQGGTILAPIDLAPTLKDIEEQQKPTPWESIKNSISNIGNQLQGFDDRLTIFTTDVYEKVFGKDLGGKIYAFLDDGIITGLPGQDGDKEGLLRRRREEAYEELRRLGEEALPTLGITDSFNSGRIENLAAGIVNAVSAVAGTALVSVPTGGAGLFTEMIGGSLYDYNTAKAEAKGITTKELIDSGEADFWTPFTIGSIGGGLERVGFSGITKSITRKLSGSAAKKAVVLGLDWNKEASTEWVQGGLEAYNKAIAQGGTHEQAIEAMSSHMASEEGLEEYLMGLFGSAGATAIGRLSKGVINKASKDKIRKNANEIQTMVSDMSKTTDPSTRSSLLEVVSEKANEILSAKQESNDIESQLTDEQKTEVNELTSIIDSIDDGLANSELSDVSTEALNARKAELEKQVDKIITTREPSTDIAPEAVDKRIQDFRDNNPNVELDDPMDSIPESVYKVMSRIEDNLPVDPVSAKETSDTLYAKYKELSDMKKDPNRTLTIAEIDGYMEQLESDIETLENYTTEGTPVQEQTQENETTETEIQPETTQEVSEVSLESSEVAPVAETTGQTQELVNEPSPVKPVIETTREPRSSETAIPRQDMPPNNQDNPRLKSLIRVLPRQDTAEMRGPANVEYRRDVIESITGERPAKKDAGIANVRRAIADYLGIDLENTSGVDFADMVRNWANSPDSSPKKSSAQQPVAQAQSSGTQLDPNTVSIPVSDITTDEASFQNRESLDTERVDNIVNNFNEVKFDPIVVYNDDGKMVVLSGHHRFAAAQRMGMKNIPSREFKGTREEAIEFARDSNTLSRPETSVERASRYRDMRSKGESESSIRDKARTAHGSEATKILNLSRLSENGKAMEAIRSFQDSTDTDTRNKVEAIGDWIGNIKSRHPDLSTRQENEMFDYLMERYGTKKKSGAVTNRSQFFDIANALVDRLKNRGDFNSESVLNFNNAAGKSGIEIEYDETLAEAKENVTKARKSLDDARARAVSEGMNPNRMNKVLAPLEDNLRNAIADEQAVRAQKGQLQEAVRAQTSIFDIINQNEEQIESNATVEREVQSAFNGEPTENTEASRSDQEVRQESPTEERVESSTDDAQEPDQTTDKPAKPRTPKTLLKGVVDRLSKTGLAKSVSIKNSQEISEDLSRRGSIQFQTDATELSEIESTAKANGTWMKAPNGKATNLNEKQWVLVRTKAFKDWFGDWENNPEGSSKVVDANGEPMVVYHGTNGNFTVFDPSKIGTNANAEGPGFYFTNDKRTAEGYQNANKDNPNLFEVFLNIRNPINLNEPNFKKSEIKRVIKAVINNEIAFDPDGTPNFRDSFMSNFVDTYDMTESRAIDEVANILMEDDTKIDFIAGLGNAVGSQPLVLQSVQEALGYDATISDGYGGMGKGGGSIFVAWDSNQIKSATDNVGTFDGTNPDIRFQTSAWHGSPHVFDKFSTSSIGSGEGAQAFGWGLYFTDLESIAREYANALVGKPNHTGNSTVDWVIDVKKPANKNELLKELERILNEKESVLNNNVLNDNIKDRFKDEIKEIKEGISIVSSKDYNFTFSRNLYSVTLHKGKQPSEYTWLEWDKPVPTKVIKIVEEKLTEEQKEKGFYTIVKSLGIRQETIYAKNGEDLYNQLTLAFGSDKAASLFLLENGIDGVKYPAESISRGATSDTARGFNYVVFDENAVEIEERIQFQKGEGINGYVDADGNIVINSDTAGLDTPIHEFAHIWERTIEKTNPLLHAQGMELIAGPDGKPYVDHVRQTQPGLEGRELYKEALAQAIGDRGARLIESQKQGPIKEWLKKAWEFIGNLVGISSMSPSEIAGLTLEQYADAAAVDLLQGKPIAKLPSGDVAIKTTARTEADMDDADKFMADFISRMKLKNGVNFQGNVSGGLSTDDFKDLTRYFRYAIEKGQISTLSDARLMARSMGISSPADVDMAFKLAKTRGSGAVGFKKSEVSEETIANTDFAKMTDEEYREMGRSLVEQGLVNPNELVAEIIQTPRALQPWEVTALQYYRSNIESEMAEISSKLDSNDANYTYRVGGETLTGYKAMAQRMAFINEALFDLEVAMLTTANQQSAAFRLRSVMADKDFNIVQFLAEMKARGAIDPDLEQKLINLSNELNVVRAKLKEKSKEVDELQERIAVENINYTAQQPERTRRVKPKKEVLATIEMTLNTIDPSAFGLPGMSFQANNTILFQTNPNPSLSDAVANAVSTMRSNISEGRMNIADAIEQAVADVDAVVGKGNWDSMKFKSEIANKLVGQGVAVQMKAPYVNTDGRLIVPGAYITSIARNGADTLDKMVQRVNDDLGGRFSEYDIRNAISGYGRQTAKTRTDLDRAISKAKRIAKLLSEIEDLESKGKRLKTRKQVDNNDAEIEALKQQVKRLEYDLEMTPEERDQLAEQRYNENRRKYLRSYIDNIQERIDNKDFAPKSRKNKYEEDSETQQLRAEAERIKNEFKKEKYRHELETRPLNEKIREYAYDLIFNITRALSAGFDASAIGVQAFIFSASRPVKAFNVLKDSMKGSFSEAEYESYFANLQADPLYEVARKAKLNLQLPNFYQSVQEEQFKGSIPAYLLDYVTGAAGEMVAKMRGGDVVKARQFAQDKFNLAKIADRNYSLVLSKVRMDLFREFVTNQVNKRGLDVELDATEVARIAEVVNTITMASKVPGVEGKVANDITSMIMFSARKFVATWKILGAWIPLAINNRQLLKDAYGGVIARGLGTLFTIAALPNIMGTLMAAYSDEDDEEDNYWYNKHWLNPKHSDFLKIRLGNTRISLFNGIDGNIIFATRFLSGEYMTSSSEAVKELGGASNNKTRGSLSWEYISNKFAPTTSIATNYFLYSDRERQESYERFKESLAPMWATGMYEQYVNTGNVGETMALGAAGFFGLAYNNYGGAEFAKGPGSDNIKARSIFDKSGLSAYDPGNGVRKYFDGESESAVKGKNYKDVYLPAYQEFMREAVLSHEKNLSPDKHWEYKEGLVNNFKKEAYKHAELELSGVVFTSAFKDVSYDGQKYVIPKSLYKLKADYIKQYMDEYSRDLALYKEDIKYEFLEREGVKPTDRYLEMLAKNELYKEAQREANQRMIDDMEMGKIKLIPKDEYVSSEDNFEDE